MAVGILLRVPRLITWGARASPTMDRLHFLRAQPWLEDDGLGAAASSLDGASSATAVPPLRTAEHTFSSMASLSRLPTNPLFPDRAAANPGSDKRLTQLVLELLRDPKGLDDLQVASLWFSLFCIMCQRPELGVVTANGGIFEIGVAELRES